jgi:hypothetical protein
MEPHVNVVIVEDVFGEWFKLTVQNAICKFQQLITRIISKKNFEIKIQKTIVN